MDIFATTQFEIQRTHKCILLISKHIKNLDSPPTETEKNWISNINNPIINPGTFAKFFFISMEIDISLTYDIHAENIINEIEVNVYMCVR